MPCPNRRGGHVATVAELRTQARKLEEAGDSAQALALYDELLRQFEQAPDSVEDVSDVYVRAGDLRIQLRQPARAFASYQQAAEVYAKLGSAKDIKTLCVRMINVVPAAGNVYARYARRLYENGHVESALDVLVEYASKAERDLVTDAVNALVARPSGERRSMMLDLLNTIDADTTGQVSAARRVSGELRKATDPTATDHLAGVRFTVRNDEPVHRVKNVVRRSVSSSTRDAAPITVQNLPDGLGTERSIGPRLSWGYVGGALGIVAVVLVGVASFKSDGSSDAGSVTTVGAVIDSSETSDDTRSGDSVIGAAQPPVANTSRAPTTQSNSSTPTIAGSRPVTDAVNALDSARAIAEPIIVESLLVRSVSEVEFRGQRGFRVVHLLDSVAEFIVESYSVDSSSANSYPLGTVIVNTVPPDTTVSIVRFDEEYLVFASGLVSEDSARVLIGLLRVRAPSN